MNRNEWINPSLVNIGPLAEHHLYSACLTRLETTRRWQRGMVTGSMQRWEYLIIYLRTDQPAPGWYIADEWLSDGLDDALFDELGAECWELVATAQRDGTTERYVFKRPRQGGEE